MASLRALQPVRGQVRFKGVGGWGMQTPCAPGSMQCAQLVQHRLTASLPAPLPHHPTSHRALRMPENANMDEIKARYENGVLKLDVPKKDMKKEEATKRITVG